MTRTTRRSTKNKNIGILFSYLRAGALGILVFACLLHLPVQAKRVELDGEWYEACYGNKYRDYQKNIDRFRSNFKNSLKKGHEWHDSDSFAGTREYRTDVCTIAGGGEKFFSILWDFIAWVTGFFGEGQEAAEDKVWGDGFQLIALYNQEENAYTIELHFHYVDPEGNPLQGSNGQLLTSHAGDSVEVEVISAEFETKREGTVDESKVEMLSAGLSQSKTTYKETVWAIGGASFTLPSENMKFFQTSGVKFRIYGENVPKTAFYLPPEFLRAFLDAIAKFDASNYSQPEQNE
ncbi:MAG: hypothetical protein ISN29_01290 [Gammaproteobacteria bacterium AqS3]|nr:hypothetical protein [Gammaproteobacteria bacterium AqS3]